MEIHCIAKYAKKEKKPPKGAPRLNVVLRIYEIFRRPVVRPGRTGCFFRKGRAESFCLSKELISEAGTRFASANSFRRASMDSGRIKYLPLFVPTFIAGYFPFRIPFRISYSERLNIAAASGMVMSLLFIKHLFLGLLPVASEKTCITAL